MKYVVKGRDLKWAGQRLKAGEEFTAETDRDMKSADLLHKIGKAEPAPEKRAVRKVAETRAPERKVQAEEAPAPAPAPAPDAAEPTPEADEKPARATRAEPLSTADLPRYSTRRLKAED
jgi:outer membrane biosynthesis protein TonB